MTRLLRSLLVLFLALSVAGPAHAQTPARSLFTSDVHFNALADPALADRLAAAPVAQWDAIFASGSQALAPYRTDTNASLLHVTLAQMKAAVPDPDVVFISGDFLAHQYRKQWNAAATDRSEAAFDAFVDKTIAYLAVEFDVTFPHAQFVITLGNNDSPCDDYAMAPNSPFLAHFARAWEPLVDRGGRAPDFIREFPQDGDYVASLPNGTQVVAVDSNVWSPSALTTCDPSGTAAADVMRWFERAVAAEPAGARTWALLHVPPGIDPYASIAAKTPVSFYRPELLARFRAVRAADGHPLGLIVAGHLHNDGFRIVDQTPLLLVPSISPIHSNNPSFFVARLDAASGSIADYQAYALDDHAAPALAPTYAPEYDFDRDYALDGFSLASLRRLQQALHDMQAVRDAEALRYVSGSPVAAITPATWRAYWCADTALEPAPYAACLGGT